MDDDWPMLGDCGDTARSLERNVRPSMSQVLAGIGAQLRKAFTVNRVELGAAERGVIETPSRFNDGVDYMPFWGGTP